MCLYLVAGINVVTDVEWIILLILLQNRFSHNNNGFKRSSHCNVYLTHILVCVEAQYIVMVVTQTLLYCYCCCCLFVLLLLFVVRWWQRTHIPYYWTITYYWETRIKWQGWEYVVCRQHYQHCQQSKYTCTLYTNTPTHWLCVAYCLVEWYIVAASLPL